MVRRDGLDVPVIGVAKAGWTLEQLRAAPATAWTSTASTTRAVVEKLTSLLRYVDGDYDDAATFVALRKELGDAKRPLHYLAIPPGLFGAVVSCARHAPAAPTDARVVVEKPFGRDLASARS